jgi:hypothetical protein
MDQQMFDPETGRVLPSTADISVRPPLSAGYHPGDSDADVTGPVGHPIAAAIASVDSVADPSPGSVVPLLSPSHDSIPGTDPIGDRVPWEKNPPVQYTTPFVQHW